jgi:hypothetical protein
MAVKVDAKIKEMFDPNQYTNNLKSKVSEYAERIKTMRLWWSKGRQFPDYVAKYGDPAVGDIDGDEDEIMSQIVRTQSVRQTAAAGGAPAASIVAASAMAAGAGASLPVIADVQDEDENDSAQVKEVKRQWNNELNAHVDQALRQEEELRMRQLQDLEEAKQAGIDEKTLQVLKQEHAEELAMMREQNDELRREIVRQKNKEEVVALLNAASQFNDVAVGISAHSNGQALSQDEKRIQEIVEHLQETSESKDEVLNRMFELICYYERQIENHDANLQAIAQASSGGDSAYQKLLLKAKQRQEELQTALFLKDEEIQALRQSNRGGGGDSSGLGALWAQASSVNPGRSDVEELQTHALLLKEKLEDACRQIIQRSGGSTVEAPGRSRPSGGYAAASSHGSTQPRAHAERPSARPAESRPAPTSSSGTGRPAREQGSPSPDPRASGEKDKKKKFWEKFEKLHHRK